MPARPLAAALLSVLVVLVGAGCSGAGDEGASSTSIVPTSGTVDPAVAPFCEAFGALLVGPLAEGGFDTADPSALGGAVQLTVAVLDEVVRTAPPEAAPAVAEVEADYQAAFVVLERYGYDLARLGAEATPEEQAVLDAFGAGGGAGGGAFTELQGVVVDRCGEEDLPPELTTTTTAVAE